MPTSTEVLEEKIDFLQQKNQALALELDHVTEENGKLKADLKAAYKSIDDLKNMLMNASQMNSTDITFNYKNGPTDANDLTTQAELTLVAALDSLKSRSESTYSDYQDIRSVENGFSSPNKFGSKASSVMARGSSDRKKGLEVCVVKQPERSISGADHMELCEVERQMMSTLDNDDCFYQANNIMKLGPYSPFTKTSVQQNEKAIDGIEGMLKNWTKKLKEVDTSCAAFSKSIEAFAMQLAVDKDQLNGNKELQNLIMVIAQSFKQYSIYLDVFTKNTHDSIINPLKLFYKKVLPSYKDSKKKFQKTLEELETVQTKYLTLKRTSLFKDPLAGQNLLNNYMNVIKVFEVSRLEYIQALNDINMGINIELTDKLCYLFTSHMNMTNSSVEAMKNSDRKIKLYFSSIMRREMLKEDITIQFNKLREDIEQNVYINYPAPPVEGIIKEGFLFTRPEGSKEIKKKYYAIKNDGALCLVKDDASSEEPVLEELTNLKLCNVKENTDSELLNCFELVGVSMKKPIIMQADSERARKEWIDTIRKLIETLLFTTKSNATDREEERKALNQKRTSKLKEAESTSPFRMAKEQLISQIIEKNNCADCGAPSPSWISLNLGVIICIECSGVHRRLGPTVSKVRSLKLDNLSSNVLDLFTKLDIKSVNGIWERILQENSSLKISPRADMDKREVFIRKKYVEKAFIKPLEEPDIKEICRACKDKDLMGVLNVLASTTKDLNKLYKIENRQQTVLHYACAFSNKEIVELLLRNGCSIDIEDEDMCIPLDRALLANNNEVIQIMTNKLEDMEF